MYTLGSSERPLRVAIVGSGPSGFYAAAPLFKADIHCSVDMFDRLPTPFGLVRGGIAPDHPKIRKVSKVYEKIADNKAFSFFGNVTVGKDITVDELKAHYDAIIFACGAETDRRLGIPGEDLIGSHTATSFVGWYNGHPDYRHLEFDLSQEVAVVIGIGNVAMDVARILAKTVDELKHTDIAQHALDALAESKVRKIYVVGRRSAAQAAFTPAEIKEMGELEACTPIIAPGELELNPVSQAELSDRNKKRNMEIMQAYSASEEGENERSMIFRFLAGPVQLKGESRVESIVLERNQLSGDEPFKQKARSTGETEEIPCGLVFRSIGYRGVAIPGVPFHEAWGIFPNEEGRITDDGVLQQGLYAVGWIKRGPSGIVGTNKPDSLITVNKLLEDVPQLSACPTPSSESVSTLLAERGIRVVNLTDWHKIDEAEVKLGEAVGKPRERFTTIEEMLSVLT
jgi:ferredoxin--NADP+ reductase